MKFLGAVLLLGVLAACAGLVSFRNASFSEGDTTRTVSGLLAKPEGKGPISRRRSTSHLRWTATSCIYGLDQLFNRLRLCIWGAGVSGKLTPH
jgi:hypothetical protein